MALYTYISKQYLKWLTLTFAIFGSLFSLIDFLELLRRSGSSKSIPVSLLLKMLLYRFPSYIQEITPFILFFTTILCLWRLNKSNEVVVMRAAGVSVWQLLSPLILLSLFIAVLDVFALNPFSSRLLERFFTLENTYFQGGQSAVSASSTNGLWFREVDPTGRYKVVRADHFDTRQSIFTNIQIMFFDENEHFLGRVDGGIAFLRQHTTNEASGTIDVENGWSIQQHGYPKKFDTCSYPSSLTADKIKDSFLNPKTLSVFQLRSYGNNLEKSGLSAKKYFLRWHSLIAKILWITVLVIFAAGFTLNPVRSGKTAKLIAFGVVIAFVLYFLKNMTYAMGSSGQIPIILAAWLPTFVTGIFALTRLLYKEEG